MHPSGDDDAVDGALQDPADTLDESDRVLTREEREDLVEADSESVEVTFATQDYPVDALVRRVGSEAILIPRFGHSDRRIETAGFQRGFVWTRGQMDKFVESLLLGYPVPGIFLVKQADGRLLVLDGQQRLLTLAAFYKGVHRTAEFKLKNVSDRFKNLLYETLPPDLRRRLDDSYMQATIVAHDGSSQSAEAIYKIFERLNSGGTQLTPHEIRVALVAGDIVDLLSRLNRNQDWRDLFGSTSARLRDQELILRILALFADADSYKRPLKTFLNSFAIAHRNDAEISLGANAKLFEGAAALLNAGPGRRALRGLGSKQLNATQVNAAQAEAVFVGLMRTLASGKEPTPDAVSQQLDALLQNSQFATSTQSGTADLEAVRTRLREAAKEFAS